eukprot:EG_transcript_20491
MTDMSHEALPQRHRERHHPKGDHTHDAEGEESADAAVPKATETEPATESLADPSAEDPTTDPTGPPSAPAEEEGKEKGEAGADAEAADGAAEGASGLPAAPAKVHEGRQFEFLDHTADVQIHSWGKDLTEAFEYTVLAMFNYCTELSSVEIDPTKTIEVEVQGHDLYSLLFSFMDEFLYHFSADFFVLKEVNILEFDAAAFRIRARAWGERFIIGKHPQGTEIKAITFSNMQIWEDSEATQIYVIVDI